MIGSSQDCKRSRGRFQGRKRSSRGGPSGLTQGEKRRFEDSKPTVPAKRVKIHYKAKEKADYRKKKDGARKVKKEGSVAPAGEIKHKVWAEAHPACRSKGCR